MSLPWFRMYHEFAGDPVIQCLAFEDQRHFVMVLCLKAAGFLDREWSSEEMRHRMICHALGLDPVSGAEAKRRLMEVAVVGVDWQPANWDKRQFQSDFSTIRSRNWRAKKKATSPQRFGNVPETAQDTDTDTDTDTDQNRKIGANAPHRSAKKSASRIPDDFDLNVERHAYAVKELPKVDAASLFAEFRDHWTAASGTTARKADWDAAWRTWVRRAARYGYPMVTEASAPQKQIRFDANGRQIGA